MEIGNNSGLRRGFSTGSVSTAAIKASVRYYFKCHEFLQIEIKMPGGENVAIGIAGLSKKNGGISSAVIIKNSGDDPDVTNGIKICADFMFLDGAGDLANILLNGFGNVQGGNNQDNLCTGDGLNLSENSDIRLHLYGEVNSAIMKCLPDGIKSYYGKLHIYNIIKHSGLTLILSSSAGIGIVRRPGLPVKPGFPAINPVPFKMIERAVKEEIDCLIGDPAVNKSKPNGVPDNKILLSILYAPDGEIVAKKTLNARLGVEGGISILGTTGYVIPVSAKAWLGTIKSSLVFLSGNGITECVYTPGRFSEKIAMGLFKDMPRESFIEIGDYISYSVKKATEFGIKRIIFVGQFGKIVKILQGARNTNAKYGSPDLRYLGLFIKTTLEEYADMPADAVNNLYEKIINSNTSRQAYDHIVSSYDFYEWLPDKIFRNILKRARENLIGMAEKEISIDIVLISYTGGILTSTL